jgi:hypothetical protein
LPPSAVVKTPQVFRSRNRCRRYRRVRKSLKGSFAARGTLKNLRRNALSLGMLGKLLGKAITSPGEGHLHICDGAFTELVRYHGLSPSYDGSMLDRQRAIVCLIADATSEVFDEIPDRHGERSPVAGWASGV